MININRKKEKKREIEYLREQTVREKRERRRRREKRKN
jgi:hypothetical protein